MKSFYSYYKKFLKDNRGVFGLTSVQQFFAIILGIALLAYIIVVIFGTLTTTNILLDISTTVHNETGSANSTGYTLSTVATIVGWNNPSALTVYNISSVTPILLPAANYSLSSAGVLKNGTATGYNSINITYSYSYYDAAERNSREISGNVSSGITSFFSSITSVYSILAILVIILVLVVLVRVVTGGTGSALSGTREFSPQL